MKNTIILSTALILFSIFNINAQKTLVGKITDAHQKPLTDAMVYVDTIKVDTRINNRGYFTIKVPENTQKINVYSPVYGLLSNPYNGEEQMNFVFLMKGDSASSSDVVNVDYNDLIKNDNSNNNNKEIDSGSDKNTAGFSNIYDYIRGKVTGVSVSPNNVITIRGVNSVSGSNQPLLVVDGFPVNSISHIDVNQVKKITVLKDGASIYGSRGSNGVLVIELKK